MLIEISDNEKTFLDETKVLIHKRHFDNDKFKISGFTNGEDFLNELSGLKVYITDNSITMTFMVRNQ